MDPEEEQETAFHLVLFLAKVGHAHSPCIGMSNIKVNVMHQFDRPFDCGIKADKTRYTHPDP